MNQLQGILTEENVREVQQRLEHLATSKERFGSPPEPHTEPDSGNISGMSSRDMSRNTSAILDSLETSPNKFTPMMQLIKECDPNPIHDHDASVSISQCTPNPIHDPAREKVSEKMDNLTKDDTKLMHGLAGTEQTQCPVQITILGDNTEDHVKTPLSSDSGHHLSVSRPRKYSNSSSTSEEYNTAPSSPVLAISRSMSIESTEEMHVRIEVTLPATEKKYEVRTKTSSSKNNLQINITFQQSSQRSRQRSFSSPSSTPNSPIPTKKTIKPQLSLDKDSPVTSPTETQEGYTKQRQKNYLIEHILQRNMVEFVKSTDLVHLNPHLFACGLLSKKDIEDLNGIKTSRGKNNFFYMLLLNTKGMDAYENMFQCLKEEKEHKGHEGLVKIITSGLRQVEKDEL